MMSGAFDPDAAALPGSGIFGLPDTYETASIILVPAPFDATTSFGRGTASGPAAIKRASAQVDLYDHQFGDIYRRGIFMEPEDEHIRHHSEVARALCEPIIARGGANVADADDVRMIEESGQAVNASTYAAFQRILRDGKTPALIGGDHSTPFGAIRACAEQVDSKDGLGVLHLDAHMDLRDAYEGFRWSHASIMFNVLEQVPAVSRLVQVGIRDFGRAELSYAGSHGHGFGKPGARVQCHFDLDWARRMDSGESFIALCRGAVEPLPRDVYISFDIDALGPALCPHTGTPVPGGLTFSQACMMLGVLKESGRRVVGFDLVEVCPGPNPDEPDLDSNVGARVLYKLCGLV